MREVKRWKCDYCRKTLAKRSEMARHEERCVWNPESKSCATCANCEFREDRDGKRVPVCSLGKFDEASRTAGNPFGMRRGCIFHRTDPNRF